MADTGDAVQYGGRHLCAGGVFPTPTGRGRFSAVEPAGRDVPPDHFHLSTRRGKQFNSMLHGRVDPLTGAGRDAVFVDPADAGRLGLAEGDDVVVRSDVGQMPARVKLARLPSGTVQVHFPEGNVLIRGDAGQREPGSRVPDYNAIVTIEPAAERAT
jgi:anaerobic selenocysteine-containing dehydrogenase